jgi:dTDP-6-deoxy-L-talose 4-dehydrogenase (NAD+)
MRYLVTGADGFVGTHLVSQLLAKGHSVVTTSNDPQRAAKAPWFDSVTYEEFDLNRLPTTLPESFLDAERVVHLAWSGLPRYMELSHIEQDLMGSYRFLKELAKRGVPDITVLGTCLEYGMCNGELGEETEPCPNIPYSVAKDALRRFLQLIQREIAFRLKWVRLFYIYGPGQRENSLIGALDAAISRGESVFEMSPGEQIRDYLHIDDAARAIAAISEQERVLGVINCGSGRPISVRRFVEEYLAKRNVRIALRFGVRTYPEYEPLAFWASTAKLRRAIGEEH